MTKRKKLKLFRVERDLNQGDMSAKIGFSRSLYTLIERGERDGSLDFWQSFQRAFNVSDADMWGFMKREEKSKQGEGSDDE